MIFEAVDYSVRLASPLLRHDNWQPDSTLTKGTMIICVQGQLLLSE